VPIDAVEIEKKTDTVNLILPRGKYQILIENVEKKQYLSNAFIYHNGIH